MSITGEETSWMSGCQVLLLTASLLPINRLLAQAAGDLHINKVIVTITEVTPP